MAHSRSAALKHTGSRVEAQSTLLRQIWLYTSGKTHELACAVTLKANSSVIYLKMCLGYRLQNMYITGLHEVIPASTVCRTCISFRTVFNSGSSSGQLACFTILARLLLSPKQVPTKQVSKAKLEWRHLRSASKSSSMQGPWCDTSRLQVRIVWLRVYIALAAQHRLGQRQSQA